MTSKDSKRLKDEYWQLKLKCDKLNYQLNHNLNYKIDDDMRKLLDTQLYHMQGYLRALMLVADKLYIDLTAEDNETNIHNN